MIDGCFLRSLPPPTARNQFETQVWDVDGNFFHHFRVAPCQQFSNPSWGFGLDVVGVLKLYYICRVLEGGCSRGRGNWGTLRIPKEDWEP